MGMLPLLRCCFAHLLILQYPDHHQNLISSSLYYSGSVHKISSQSVHNFLSNVVHRLTDRQTDKLTNATKNITSFAKEVIMFILFITTSNKICSFSFIFCIQHFIMHQVTVRISIHRHHVHTSFTFTYCYSSSTSCLLYTAYNTGRKQILRRKIQS